MCDSSHSGRFLLTWSHEASRSVQSCSATPVQPVIRLGSHSSENKDVDHDAPWLARSFAVRFTECSPRLCCRACWCPGCVAVTTHFFQHSTCVLYHSCFRKVASLVPPAVVIQAPCTEKCKLLCLRRSQLESANGSRCAFAGERASGLGHFSRMLSALLRVERYSESIFFFEDVFSVSSGRMW